MPFPIMSEDDVVQFCVVEAVTAKAAQEQLEAEDEAKEQAQRKAWGRGEGLKAFGQGKV